MGQLINIITSDDMDVRNTSLDSVCKNLKASELLEECNSLEIFRKESSSLYDIVRSLFFLYAIHRFYIPFTKEAGTNSLISYEAYTHLLKRRFEEAIVILNKIQQEHGPNEGICSGLAEAYHKLAFETLGNQVKKSVRSTLGNQWMFRVGHPLDHPLKVREELTQCDAKTGMYPLLKESTPVRMDITHSGWSDIFFLGMDFPEGAQVLNVSVDLSVHGKEGNVSPTPPIETYFRIIDREGIMLTCVDLNASVFITNLDDIFDFAKDYLGLLKAALIASGIVPPGMEGANVPLKDLLIRLVGFGKGIELVSKVNNIPKGSRLAVSTNLLASLISVCMRATKQTREVEGELLEEERRLVAARAILGEWIGGSGGGWQDSGGVWPAIKTIRGVKSKPGDPENGISRGRLLPQHTIMSQEEVTAETREKLQNSLVMVHGGMAQDVGPILEMVTEKYLLRSEKEWHARKNAITYFDNVIEHLKEGNIQKIGLFTHENFEGPIQTIIPWTNNYYTSTLIKRVKEEFKENFWGFWMMGGMSGGGMGFIFHPDYKKRAMGRLQEIMSDTKSKLQNAVPFAMEPVVYDFKINEHGTFCERYEDEKAMMPHDYYTLIAPPLLKHNIQELSDNQRRELELLGKYSKNNKEYDQFIPKLFERMIPQGATSTGEEKSLDEMLNEFGFDRELHQQMKAEIKSGRIGISQNRLPQSSKIEDVDPSMVFNSSGKIEDNFYETGKKALENGELAIVTLAGGVGSRWTKGAGVVKSLNPFSKFEGKHRNFIEIHLAKSKKISDIANKMIPHIFTTSYMTNQAIKEFLEMENNYGYEGPLYLSQGKVVGLRLVPTERDLRYIWEEMPQQMLDEQSQKMQDSLHNALINWAKGMGEAEDYTENLPHQCIHPVGHWFEIPNLFINGTIQNVLKERPNLKHLMIHNIDTLGTNADPALLGYHIEKGSTLTAEVITRKIDDRGGGLANIDGRVRLIEGLALPNEKVEFNLKYYNTNTTWVDIDKLLEIFGLTRNELDNKEKVRQQIWKIAQRIPTYITIKDVKKRWGKGQEDVFPVSQWEKLWGDMTAISELDCSYMEVSRMRGQQLKEPAQLDGWLRDGSAEYVNKLCKW